MNVDVSESMVRAAWVAWNTTRSKQAERCAEGDEDMFSDYGDDEMMRAAISAALTDMQLNSVSAH